MNNIETYYPVTPLQQGLIFHSLLDPESGAYIVQLNLKLQGALDIPAFEQAWQSVIDRHAIFRTRFIGGKVKEYVQVVLKEVKARVNVQDLTHLSTEEQEAFLHEYRMEDRKRGFNIEEAPLIRLNLFLLDKDVCQFMWTCHHVLLDGWSMPLVFGEVFGTYDMIRSGKPVQLPPVRAYRDYIVWLKKQNLANAEEHWRQKLKGFYEPTPLVFERSYKNKNQVEKQYVELDLELDESVSKKLQTLARQNRLTVNTIVQGAWALLLNRYSGKDDIVFGATVSGRPADLPGVETMIGLFINTLPVRIQIDPEQPVTTWLKAIQQQQNESRQYEFTPLVEIQGWSDVARGMSLFESILVFENYPIQKSAAKDDTGLSILEVESEEQTNYPLTLVAASSNQVVLKIKYDQTHYEREGIQRVLKHLGNLLQSIAKEPTQRLSQLSMTSQNERDQLLIEWNQTEADYPHERCIHEWFETQAQETPDAIAVEHGDQSVTYAELNLRANQLAHHLQKNGAGSDQLIGICTERSIEMIVGILGVMKAGAAYVPIDPAHPQERIAYMLEDTQAKLVLTQSALLPILPATEAKVICLDSESFTEEPSSTPDSGVTSRHLAYVIYTSGSTGQPKGVMIEHHSAVNMAQSLIQAFDVNADSRVLQFTSFSFDVSVSEITMALLSGATLLMEDRDALLPGPELNRILRERRVTTVSMASSVLAALPFEEFPDLRTLIVGGEAPSRELIERYAQDRAFFNCYGPTEATVTTTLARCTDSTQTPPIGRPIQNAKVYVLDEHLQPVPVGVPGELYIGGVGLARGYWNRPELTAERFIANPFGAEGERLYRTGDLVRYLTDGNLEFVGRIDDQVKVRGYRIELGEIEATLRLHPGVKDAVVIAREDRAGDKRLAAYMTTASEQAPAIDELTDWLKQTLPSYMIPSGFMWLDAIPLTVNGKVDRRALPAPDWGQTGAGKEYVAPRNPTEEIVANIYSQVLSVEQVSIYDDFFELGGHSLLATQTNSRLREAFGVEIPLRALFDHSTVVGMSAYVTTLLENEAGVGAGNIETADRSKPLPLSFAQQRLWFFDRLMPDSALYNIPSAMRIKGDLNVQAWEQSCQAIINRHESLRTTFTDLDGQAVQVLHPEIDWKLTFIDVRGMEATEKEAEVQRLAMEDATKPFDLTHGPLMRASLIQVEEQEYVFLLNMHHIVADGWSLGVLTSELVTYYQGFSKGEQPTLPDMPIQYADFAVWQREWLQGEVLEQQLSYWKNKLQGSEPLLQLPTDRPRPAVQTYEGAVLHEMFTEELKNRLLALSKREGATLFMTLLAAFQALMHRYTGQEDIVVGSPVAGRNRQETEGLIGFFINTLVMRTDLSQDPTFKELLGRVRETALGAYTHQDLPFEKLVDELELERSLSYSPLFQVMFVLQNIPMEGQALTDLQVLPFESGENQVMTKFDLTLTMAEAPNGLVATFEYNTALFDESTIRRMIGHFQHMLTAVTENPAMSISGIPLLDEAEQKLVTNDWNQTAVSYPREKTVHQLFHETQALYADRLAVITGDESLTYAELDRRANQVANYLQKQGVQAGSLVGICAERSLEMIVGLIGILKAGAAYVPLDPAYPQDRLSYMMEDAQVSILLSQQHLIEKLPAGERTIISLDSDWSLIAQESEQAPQAESTADQLAYVIYTSGSTGTPKGVLTPHRAIIRLITATNYVTITEEDVFLQASTVSFDAATFEIWGSLLNGAKLVLMPPHLPSLDELGEAIQKHQVTTMWLTAGLFTLMVDHRLEYLRGVRQLLVGGDVVSVPHVRKALTLEGLRLINGYGPTETTTFACCYPFDSLPEQVSSLPIGRPIQNTTVYILDKHMKPVPLGVPGELYIGGDGLALGYLNNPELTAERFVANPFSDDPEARLYKTGDSVRYLPDGTIEFIGRIDQQVKIRGFRIELGEIEAALYEHPAIQEAIVMVRQDTPGDKRLAAYLVSEAGTEIQTGELRMYLKAKLPDYMIPSAFVVMEQLPLTPNGKVDRKALPVPEYNRAELEGEFVAPATEMEKKLAEIWQGVLNVENVGIHDNFFALGGDSILSIQIVARANQAGLRLSPKQLFEHQTIAELALVVGVKAAVHAEQGVVTGEAPLLPIQQWFFGLPLENRNHWNQSVLLSVPPQIDTTAMEKAVQHVMAQHDALRLRFTQTEAGWTQELGGLTDNVPFIVEDLSEVAASEQSSRVEEIAAHVQTTLNITEGDLARFVYYNLGADQPGRFQIVVHHLAVDGVSWRILMEDVQNFYEQIAKGQDVQTPAKSTSYKQWALELTNYANSEAVAQEKAYWLNRTAVQAAPLPVDYQAIGENKEATAKSFTLSLDTEDTKNLLQTVPQAYRTQINDVLLTALAMALSRWTNSRSTFVHLEGHGREELVETVDLSRTVGWFTSMYPVHLQWDESYSVGKALMTTKEELRSIPNKGVGYGILRYLSQDEETREKLSGLRPQISFNYLGQVDSMVGGDSLFGGAAESSGATMSEEALRYHLIDVNGIISGEQLHMTWRFNEEIHRESTIQAVAQFYMEALRQIIAHCTSEEAGSYTPSDFPLAKLEQKHIDQYIGADRTIENVYTLSPLQQGMLFHTLYAKEGGDYVVQFAVTFKNLDVHVMEQAWQKVVDRYSILRTYFIWEGLEQPHQVVRKQVKVAAEQHDWRHLTADEQQAEFEAYMEADRQRNFDIAQAPLMRWVLFRVSEDAYRFVWSMHHILLDGWSIPLVLNDWFSSYMAIAAGQEVADASPQPFANYIAWLQQQDMQEAERFWREHLQGFHTPTPLDMGKVGTATWQAKAYEEQVQYVAEDITDNMQQFTRQHQLTLNTMVQGAWAILLGRYSGLEDIMFGVTGSGRPADLQGVESMVGLFINTTPSRIVLNREETILHWLQSIQQKQIAIRQYEFTPLVEIQKWSEMSHGTPLFESLMVFENYPVNAMSEADAGSSTGLSLEIATVDAVEQTNYPLTLVAGPGKELILKLIYDTSRFEPAAITRVLEQLALILKGMVEHPEQTLATLSFISEAEREQLVVDWNQTTVPYPRELTVHELFQRTAVEFPTHTAVVAGDTSLTYAELDQRANQVAHYLRKQGVGPDTMVGICAERSVELIVGLLGILKAGGAYVPLDPSYPQERLVFMMEDANLSILLTQEHLIEKLPNTSSTHVCLDRDWAQIAEESTEAPSVEMTAEHMAYVIYTSGSTGTPKGVCTIHRGIVRLVKENDFVTITEQDVFLQASTVSFDAATFEIWGSLLNGAKLVMMPPHLPSLAELGEAIESNQVTILWLTAALFTVMVDNHLNALRSVRYLLAGGDVVSVPHVRKAMTLEGLQVVNGYGPTESTTFACCYAVTELPEQMLSLPIGRPIKNTTVYILDKEMNPVPVGVPGELYIGGDGLARGYLNRPDLTEERFVPNPFAEGSEARLYKTGDLVRYLPDGNIEFIGRIDQQVKIRGFRIELGEIEEVIRQYPAVREAVVITRDLQGDKRLVAYVTSEEGTEADTAELTSWLKTKMPEYMIPTAIVWMDSLPITPNGKVDRRALPSPDWGQLSGVEYVAPRNPTEEMVAAIWSQVLSVEQVGIHDNFFALGGHSLLATQAVSRMREAFQVDLQLRTLFEYPTVAALSDQIALLLQGQGLTGGPIQPASRDQALPLSFAQQRLWFFEQFMDGSTLYNIPNALRMTGDLDIRAWEQSLHTIMQRHETLRTSFTVADGQPIQVIRDASAWSMKLIDLRNLPADEKEAEVQRLAAEEAAKPFVITQDYLLRAQLIQTGDQEYVFLLTLHHIVADAWSLGILINELMTAYQAYRADETPQLPALPIQYADYAVWQRDWLQGEILDNQMNYWKQKLHDSEPLLQLPTDRPRPAVQTYDGDKFTTIFSTELQEQLRELSRRQGSTLFMTLLAAFQGLLHRYSGQEDILVGSPIAGRNKQETEGLIGCFINTLVMRTDLSGQPTFTELLARTRETALGAYAHQDLPFEKLVDELHLERSMSYSPLFQVMFILQNVPMQAEDQSDLVIAPLEASEGPVMSKFDLTLTMVESDAGLLATFEYNTALFEKATIERMAKHFNTFLEQVLIRADQPINTVPLMEADEIASLRNEYNQTDKPYTREASVYEQFSAQAAATPDHKALVVNHTSITYAELNARANQLAHTLIARGAGPEVLVGLSTERSIEMFVGLLGILKAGAAYVPIDPAFPQDRIAHIIEDSQVTLLLTQDHLVSHLPEHTAQVICLDSDWSMIAQASTENPPKTATADNLAYVIYTSGSTGKPKGVMLEHGSLTNFITAMTEVIDFAPDKNILSVTTISFDIFVLESLLPLTQGQCVVLATEDEQNDPQLLKEVIIAHDVKMMQTTPSRYQLILQNEELSSCLMNLSDILVGGEALTETVLAGLRKASNARIFNMYGPTETTIWSTMKEVTTEDVSIGRPIANTQVFVVDTTHNLQPAGVIGELCIAGDGLARGYWRRPDLTAERFVPNPYGAPGSRMYKTGDLARYLPNGELQYMGRNDYQVKVRGYRIELGEIEATIRQHPDVKEAIVLAREDQPGDKRLVAYLICQPEAEFAASELNRFLADRLPSYMIPSHFMKLDALPMTPNGKVDRKALPKPDAEHVRSTVEYVAPQTPTELMLHAHWSSLLGVERIGVHENFFEVGGHSMLATQLIFKVREEVQVEVPLRILFETPTIAGMAQKIEDILQYGLDAVSENTAKKGLEEEVKLDPAIQLEQPYEGDPGTFDAALLTGATGFLGAFLLRDLLKQTDADIYCLVRAASTEQGEQRIRQTLELYELWDESVAHRIVPIIGDLAQPFLGLSGEAFDQLASTIDVIYHNGALVNFIYPYAALKKPNVLGTEEILRLATRTKIKPVHFVSTIYTFVNSEEGETIAVHEGDMPENSKTLTTGYTESKWVAEHVVELARQRGIPASIYRCGRITGDTESGACQTDDLIMRIAKGCIDMKLAPEALGDLEMMPVDYTSRAIVNLSMRKEALNQNFHLLNPNAVEYEDLITAIEEMGFTIERVSMTKWVEALQENAKHQGDNAAAPLGDLFADSQPGQGSVVFSGRKTARMLKQASITVPDIDAAVFRRILEYFVRTGHLQLPVQTTK
ncbi:non-ribosomal peptide synthetase [Brevibacillus dissolubilis]|uniref:non-ribosomal peptide synthetase n=1 Tax=Brevibacillus dissolubilis TaxID=1844116 RepID=UPI001116E21A|nr:non-ribosomal peptide synthetase [Brevibacillus dissolubilis]